VKKHGAGRFDKSAGQGGSPLRRRTRRNGRIFFRQTRSGDVAESRLFSIVPSSLEKKPACRPEGAEYAGWRVRDAGASIHSCGAHYR